ncbi:hypothetical protein MTsDn5_26310 [Alteromonas gracilis]|uniref:glycosyltransferase family 2 protein n=1 Tax=Alteromonas gracilis TaxID=1479524 RepID=UPI0036F2B7EE
MKFTLAIISYNAQESIERCIKSCTNQTYRNLEILVVDDNSNDQTIEIIKKLQKNDERIKLIQHRKNRSALQARITALKNASSEYIWFIDSDDCIDDAGAIGLIDRALKRDGYPDMLCFGSYDYHENGELKRIFYDWGKDKVINEWKLDSDFRPYTRVTKRTVLEQATKVIPEDLYLYRHNDLFMFCLVKLCTGSRSFLNKPLYRYTLSNSSVTNQKDKGSVSKHASLIDTLFDNYKKAAQKIPQSDIDIDKFISFEKSKLIKYAKSQYSSDPSLYLHALKEFYCNDTQIVISLTTYSKRIATVDKVISSLLNQTVLVDKIVLWLDENETDFESLPNKLKSLVSDVFEIRFCPNYKSYKKLIPTLKLFPKAAVITFDDDIEYPRDQVEKLLVEYFENPECVITNVARNIIVDNGVVQPYSSWQHAFEEQVGKPLSTLLPIGVGGVLYPPGSLSKEVSNVESFMKYAPHGDDLWFKCMTVANGRKVITTGAGYKLGQYQIGGTADIGLWQSVNEDTDSNVEQLVSILEAYSEIKQIFCSTIFSHCNIKNSELISFYSKMNLVKKNIKGVERKQMIDAIQTLYVEDGVAEQSNSYENSKPTNIVVERDDSINLFRKANQLFLEGQYEEASAIYRKLQQIRPSFKYYKYNLDRAQAFLKAKKNVG